MAQQILFGFKTSKDSRLLYKGFLYSKHCVWRIKITIQQARNKLWEKVNIRYKTLSHAIWISFYSPWRVFEIFQVLYITNIAYKMKI